MSSLGALPMPFFTKPAKSETAHLVPMQLRALVSNYRKFLRQCKKLGWEYGDILEGSTEESRQFMLHMHQLQTLIWMYDSGRYTVEDVKRWGNPFAKYLPQQPSALGFE